MYVIEAVQAILSLHYNGGKTPKLIILKSYPYVVKYNFYYDCMKKIFE